MLSGRTSKDTELEEAFQIIAFSLLRWLDGYVWIFLVTPSVLFGSRTHKFKKIKYKKLIALRVKSPSLFQG